MIRNKEDHGYQQTTTEIETSHRIAAGDRHVVEFIIEQGVYKVVEKKFSPRKLLCFCLSPDDAEVLAQQLVDHARQAREGQR